MFTGIRLLLLICRFISSVFFLSNFQTLKCFVTLFSRIVRPRLKLGTHVDSGQMYRVYRNQTATAYSSLYFFIFFLSNFKTLKVFITLLSGTVRPRSKLGTHVDSGCVSYIIVYTRIRLLLLICPFIFFFLQYSNIKNFRHSFLRTVRPRRLKLGAHVDSGWMYRIYVYRNQAAAAYLSLYFFISFSPIFKH